MIDKKLLQSHFSRNAANYDSYANVQKKMAAELIKILKSSNNALPGREHNKIRILDVGCGTGYLTQELINTFPQAQITAVDIAKGMIEVASERLRDSNVTFLCTDVEEADISGQYDLILSNAAFQWFNNLEWTLKKLYSLLSDKGAIYFSTFGNSTFNELHQSFEMAKELLKLKTQALPGQRFYSLPDLLKLCINAIEGYDCSKFTVSGTELYEYEYFNSVNDFLKSVKKIGGNNSNSIKNKNLSLTREMMKIYEEKFTENGRVKATYHCFFIKIEKEYGSMPSNMS